MTTDDDDMLGIGGDGRKLKTDDNQASAENVTAAELRSFIERLERLAEEKKAVADDEKDVMAEAVGRGYDKKAIKKILAIRKQDAQKREEEQQILDTYLAALGMLPRFEDD